MRNSNYYQSVVRQYFESDIDKYKDAFMAKSQICDYQDSNTNSGRHDCFCNYCGDDISSRSKSLAQIQFDQFKEEFLSQQQTNIKQIDTKDNHASQNSPNGQINEQALNEKIEEINEKHTEEIKNLQTQLYGHKKANKVLSEKIQQFKDQQYLSEQNIRDSKAMQFLQGQALKLVKTIEGQRAEIIQLMHIKVKYESIKNDKEKAETMFKKKLSENQAQLSSQEEKYQGLYKKIEIFKVDIGSLKERISQAKGQGEDANMIDSTTNKAQNQSEIVLNILKELKNDFDSEKQKEEIRKKYEYYKKQAINEKSEKEAKIKELQILKEKEGEISELNDIKSKLETMKINHQKEYTSRKDKELKLEQSHIELQKKSKSLEDILSQIDQIFQANAQYEEQISTLETDNSKLTTDKQLIETKQFQVSVELLQSQQDLKANQEMVQKLNSKIEAFQELIQINQDQSKMQEKLQEQQRQVTSHYESQKKNMDAAEKVLIEQSDKLQVLKSQTNSKDHLIKELQSDNTELRSQNTSYKFENTQQKQQIKENQQSYKKALNARDQGSYDKNDVFSKNNELDYYQHEYKKYKKLVNCSICETDPKEIVLPCGHMLCEKCLKKQFSSRMRNCPIDRKKFSDKQPLKIFLNDAVDQQDNEDMQYD